MTKHEAQVRNHNILRLRGLLHGISYIIPEDVAELFPDKEEYIALSYKLLEVLDSVKVKKFYCGDCLRTLGLEGRVSNDRRAYKCDICGNWGVELYTVKKEKQ